MFAQRTIYLICSSGKGDELCIEGNVLRQCARVIMSMVAACRLSQAWSKQVKRIERTQVFVNLPSVSSQKGRKTQREGK